MAKVIDEYETAKDRAATLMTEWEETTVQLESAGG